MFQFPQNVALPPLVQWPVSLNRLPPVTPPSFSEAPDARHSHHHSAISTKAGTNQTSNITNSTDPKAINARVFVGNLNTYFLSKEAVEGIFRRYGTITGISMHKGYAFIQYQKETEARNAVTGEDQRIYAAKQIDVNMAAEPRKHQAKRKRLDDEQDQTEDPCVPVTEKSNSTIRYKRQSTFFSKGYTNGMTSMESTLSRNGQFFGNKTDSLTENQIHDLSDILICGRCRQLFSALPAFLAHKRQGCALLLPCPCDRHGSPTSTSELSDEERPVTSSYQELCGPSRQSHPGLEHDLPTASSVDDVKAEEETILNMCA